MSARHALLPACVGLVIVAGASCSRRTPTAPAVPPAMSSADASRLTGDHSVAFPLEEGAFSLSTGKGDTMTAAYDGEARVRPGGETAALALSLTGGSGSFDGIGGTLVGAGSGAFSGEGSFALAVRGDAANPQRSFNLRLNLKGASRVSCDNGRIRVTETADGTMSGAGRVTAVLSHLVGNTSCQ